MKPKPRVLIVDDEKFVRESLAELLRADGMQTFLAAGAESALDQLATEPVDVIVTDLSMPGGDGLQLLEESRARGVEIPIILLTGVGSITDAVRAMKNGAYDFLQKPVDPEELGLIVRRAAEHKDLVAEVSTLRRTVQTLRPARQLVGSSEAMTRLRTSILQVAPSLATVLVSGESGTGKALVAEAIHRASGRTSLPPVVVNCAVLGEDHFEAELFGERAHDAESARVGRVAEAEGTTLVLDEIAALPATMQARLLQFLETGVYQPLGDSRRRKADVRVIATTNQDLEAHVKSGAFRSDLLYRLKVFPIEVPPLRAHKDDIPEIVTAFLGGLDKSAARSRKRVQAPRVENDALEVLASYDWPGNVRELRNVLERALIVSPDGRIDSDLLRSLLETNPPVRAEASPREFHLRTNLDLAERDLVLRAIHHTEGRKKEACQMLGIDPRNLGYYLRKHKIKESDLSGA